MSTFCFTGPMWRDCIDDRRLPWWRHQMETFSALLALCVGNSPVTGEFPSQRPVTRSFGVFFDLRLNKRISKQSWCWWFETPSRWLWRHRISPGPGISEVFSCHDVNMSNCIALPGVKALDFREKSAGRCVFNPTSSPCVSEMCRISYCVHYTRGLFC